MYLCILYIVSYTSTDLHLHIGLQLWPKVINYTDGYECTRRTSAIAHYFRIFSSALACTYSVHIISPPRLTHSEAVRFYRTSREISSGRDVKELIINSSVKHFVRVDFFFFFLYGLFKYFLATWHRCITSFLFSKKIKLRYRFQCIHLYENLKK